MCLRTTMAGPKVCRLQDRNTQSSLRNLFPKHCGRHPQWQRTAAYECGSQWDAKLLSKSTGQQPAANARVRSTAQAISQDSAAVRNPDFDSVQRTAECRATHALATVNVEQCSVRVADDVRAILVQVRIFTPGQRRPLMRTLVPIRVERFTAANNEKSIATFAEPVEAANLAVLQVIEAAKFENFFAGFTVFTCRAVHR